MAGTHVQCTTAQSSTAGCVTLPYFAVPSLQVCLGLGELHAGLPSCSPTLRLREASLGWSAPGLQGAGIHLAPSLHISVLNLPFGATPRNEALSVIPQEPGAEDGLEGSHQAPGKKTSWLFVFPRNVTAGTASCFPQTRGWCFLSGLPGRRGLWGKRLRKWDAGISVVPRHRIPPHSRSSLGPLPRGCHKVS